ncbi:MAG: outer membrane protein assembly factor BamB family protein [Planctomycetota bacterium]|jgi:outer membrane protein assembly factor BamB
MLSGIRAVVPFASLLLAASTLAPRAEGNDDWPCFRGPTAMGVVDDDPRLPDRWSKTENVRWVTDVPGWGWSSPIVSGNRVFLTAVVNEKEYEKPKKGLYNGRGRAEPPEGVHHWMVYCFDLDSGRILWNREAHQGQPQVPRHPKNTYASETPVTDGQRVYVLFGDVGLYCYDFEGQQLWSHRIEPKESLLNYGAAASPVICGGLVIMVYDNQEDRYIAAFDASTGEQRWRTARPGQAPRSTRSTWATPFVWKNDQRTEIVTSDYRRIRSYDLSGSVLWELEGPTSNLVIPSPLAAHGMVYVTSGYVGDRDRPVYAIRPGAQGETSVDEDPAEHPHVAWFQPQAGPYNTSPIVYGDYYYTLLDRGFMACCDARTGEEVYGKTRFPEGASFTSSPWAYNGKIFCLSEDGDTYVVEAGPEFKVVGTNRLEELCLASPAVADGKLLLRTASRLYCIAR